jgi:TolB-like protein/Tfp pilus assembly protein PilF
MAWSKLQSRLPIFWVLRGGVFLACVVVILGFAMRVGIWHSRLKAFPRIRAIVVLPLRNPGADPNQYLADGMTEQLISGLGRISALRVISRTSAMAFRQTDKSLPEIARQLGVDGVVDGSVVRNGNQIRLTARLSDGKTGRQLWKREYSTNVSGTLQLGSDIAQNIAELIRIQVRPREQIAIAAAHQTDPETQDLYLQGEYFLNRGRANREAIECFQKAIDKDPSFAPAYAGLAAGYNDLGQSGSLNYAEAYSKAKAAAKKATELNPDLAEGHAALADALIGLDWDWTAAGNEFHRALELDPGSASEHREYALYLARVGKSREAVSEAETGLTLDPISLVAYHIVAYC